MCSFVENFISLESTSLCSLSFMEYVYLQGIYMVHCATHLMNEGTDSEQVNDGLIVTVDIIG